MPPTPNFAPASSHSLHPLPRHPARLLRRPPSFLPPPGAHACRGPSFSGEPSNTTCRARELTGPVRVTHPLHPLRGQVLDFVELRAHWGEERVFYRDRRGHITSLPAQWTSAVPEDPTVAMGAGRSAFRARDLLELAALLSDLRP